MKFKEALRKILAPLGVMTQITQIKTDTFNLTVNDMQYVNFISSYIKQLTIEQGQEITLNQAFVENLLSNAAITAKYSTIGKRSKRKNEHKT